MGDPNNGEDGFEVGGWYPFMDYSPISCQGFTVDSLEASRVFPIGGMGESRHQPKICSFLFPPGKIPPQQTPPPPTKFLFPPHQKSVNYYPLPNHPLNKNFQVITQ